MVGNKVMDAHTDGGYFNSTPPFQRGTINGSNLHFPYILIGAFIPPHVVKAP